MSHKAKPGSTEVHRPGGIVRRGSDGPGIGRRQFIGASLATALIPVIVPASPAPASPQGLIGPVTAPPSQADHGGDRHVDDQWGGYPRYADPGGYGRRRAAPAVAVHPADQAFVAS